MLEYHNEDITKRIPENFLTLPIAVTGFDEDRIRAKYPEYIADKLVKKNMQLEPLIAQNNQSFAIRIEHNYYITKDKNKSTVRIAVDNNAKDGIKIVKELKDPNETHKFTMKSAIKEVSKRLQKDNIDFELNNYKFNLFNKVYGIKEDKKYCYVHKQYAQPSYTYSMAAINFLYTEIKKNPENIVEIWKEKLKKS